jgi:multiple sugar transport system permease protein
MQTQIGSTPKAEKKFQPKVVLTTIIGVVLTAILLFPLYWMITNSLETNAVIFRIPAPLVPTQITFSAYTDVFTSQLPHLVTSLIIALGTVVVSLLIAIPAAYPGLILSDTTYAVPFDILIMSAFFQSLPYELVEAAFVDGTREWGAFFRIMLPLGIPGIITAGLFAFLFAWGDFLFGLTLTTTNDIQPISLSIYNYLGQFNQQWNGLMAVATLGCIPAAILFVAFQRYITAGMTSGALKG